MGAQMRLKAVAHRYRLDGSKGRGGAGAGHGRAPERARKAASRSWLPGAAPHASGPVLISQYRA